jgi:23S rRNA pseudouridine1911/1915/1917 synthase
MNTLPQTSKQMVTTFTIIRTGIDERCDKALVLLFQEEKEVLLSRHSLERAFRQSQVSINGETAKQRTRLRKGDVLVYNAPLEEYQGDFPEGEPQVVAETETLLVLNKPKGWLSHVSPALYKEKSLEDWVKEKYPTFSLALHEEHYGIAHRLDRHTSGLILVAKTEKMYEELKKMFRQRKISKTYLALVEGHLKEEEGIIDLPIQRKKGSLKRIALAKPLGGAIKEALTEYKLIARNGENDFVLIKPKTGRTHQIRAHFKAIGHPLVGDTLYGAQKRPESGQMLHAFRLSFAIKKEAYSFEAPLPEGFEEAKASLDENSL